jgi:NAD(P)-dependent dehydrogenase (short-subunit alcohol dehydrogenase family)
VITGDISVENSTQSCITAAKQYHGPINILIANAGITDDSNSYPIWKIPLEVYEKTYNTNIRGTFLTIKHFLQSAEDSQNGGKQLDNLAIVVTGTLGVRWENSARQVILNMLLAMAACSMD